MGEKPGSPLKQDVGARPRHKFTFICSVFLVNETVQGRLYEMKYIYMNRDTHLRERRD